MKSDNFPLPIYVGKRTFLGLRDLVVSLYAQKCQFKCAYCNLPEKSHPEPLDPETTKRQIDWVLDQNKNELPDFRQFSIGNEGSILDLGRFPKETLDYLLIQTGRFPNLEILSLETRPEYIKAPLMEEIQRVTGLPTIDVTVGFETQDDHLREVILKKNVRKKLMEQKIELLGEIGARLTSYVLLKPGPAMTEQDGIDEAIRTIGYLHEKCRYFNTDLVIYLNPVYASKGTPLARQFVIHGYRFPQIQSVIQIIAATKHLDVPIYTGLWSEENAEENGDYKSLDTHCAEVRGAVKQYNKTQDFSAIEPFIM
uniref:Elp3/MiaA/NifB-like radical SAM core domain-containing protein n=1 Tax=Candidatus Kentrum sp. LPFa TaxID=2126335 RepID=A0A450W798_9GAMM|nr:MAG: hypothetical protein BECKLPF1236A_GA0070988_100801 [Candidatus Kentron sp. LPFa]VFK29024.1 MAG: hypothetical protein BECKLPF1236C_GA0070990_100792 [Candidatus Kentron sp. LPFa]